LLAGSSTEIPSLSKGLVAYWSFDNCDARDDSGNGNDGEIIGSLECVDGLKGKGFLFGKGGVSIQEFPDMKTFSVAFAFKFNDLSNVYNNMFGFEPVNDEFLILFFENDPRVRIERKDSDNDGIAVSDSLEKDKWHYIVFVNDFVKGEQIVYIDGKKVNVFSNVKTDFDTTEVKIGYEGTNPLLCGTSRCGKNLPGALHCPGIRAKIRTHFAGRCARRSRNSRPPAHVHWSLAGADHSGYSQCRFQ
jgi:hypothetical protein